jgi:cytochrome c556
MKKVAYTLVLLSSLVCGPLSPGDEPPAKDAQKKEAPKTKVQELMQRKRELSHDVFDAIVAKDYKTISQKAKGLVLVSQAAEWRVMPTPRYLQYSAEFQESAEKMARNARDKNSDGTTLAFTQLMFSCIHCHDYIRDVRNARLDPMHRDIARAIDVVALASQR